MSYWTEMEELIEQSKITIVNERLSPFFKYPSHKWVVNYGYFNRNDNKYDILIGTGIWGKEINGMCLTNGSYGFSEIIFLYSCRDKEIEMLYYQTKIFDSLNAIFIRRDVDNKEKENKLIDYERVARIE